MTTTEHAPRRSTGGDTSKGATGIDVILEGFRCARALNLCGEGQTTDTSTRCCVTLSGALTAPRTEGGGSNL